MAQANADPEEIEKFAGILSSYAESLRDEAAVLRGQFESLRESWQDDRCEAFEEVLTQLQGWVNAFGEQCDEQVPYLLMKASQLREYLES